VIASYSDYLVQVMRLIDGDDVTVSDLSQNTMNQIVSLAQRRLYRMVRCRYNEVSFTTTTVTGNLAPLPLDFEAISIVHFGKKALTPVSEEWMREYLDGNPTGDARHFCASGANMLFGPAVADGTLVQGRYYARLDDLTPANFSANTLIAREPDLFIYGALVEAVPFFNKAADQAQSFAAKFAQAVESVNSSSQQLATNAARLVRKPSAWLIG
jgi:hypothetical protein